MPFEVLGFFVGMKYMGWQDFWVGNEGARQVARSCVLEASSDSTCERVRYKLEA